MSLRQLRLPVAAFFFNADGSVIRIYFCNIFALVTCKNSPIFFLCFSCGTYFNVCSRQYVFADVVPFITAVTAGVPSRYLGVLLVPFTAGVSARIS